MIVAFRNQCKSLLWFCRKKKCDPNSAADFLLMYKKAEIVAKISKSSAYGSRTACVPKQERAGPARPGTPCDHQPPVPYVSSAKVDKVLFAAH